MESILNGKCYKPKELYEFFGINTANGNGSKNLRAKLNELGYEFDWPKGKQSIMITGLPKLSTSAILKEKTQIDKTGFACFVVSFLDTEFQAMPVKKRIEYLNDKYGVQITESTYTRWKRALDQKGLLRKGEEKVFWRTIGTDENKQQEKVTGYADREVERALYNELREQKVYEGMYMNPDFLEQDLQIRRSQSWAAAIKSLYSKYGVYYAITPTTLLPLDELEPEIAKFVSDCSVIAAEVLQDRNCPLGPMQIEYTN